MNEAISPGQYIQHHLEHLTLSLKTFKIGETDGFWTLNLDTFIVSGLIAIFMMVILGYVARHMTEVPGKLQNAVEIVLEFVDNAVSEIFHHKSTFIPSLALTIFLWVFLMNAMDLLPVDFIPHLLGFAGLEHFKVVPTARLTPDRVDWLRAELEGFLGPGVSVTVDQVDRIPVEASGKRLLVRSHLAA